MKTTLLFLLYITASISNCIGQDTLKLYSKRNLKEVSVTYQADKLTPITFLNLKGNEIEKRSTGQEPAFLLSENAPSITVYSDAGNAQGYSFFRMRGIDQTRINMTLDGVPLNEPEDQGAYFSNYPDIFNSVSKIQIQRGVGTSKNGVAGYAGSIQLFSPNLYDSAKTTFGFGVGSFTSLRTFGEYNSGVKNQKAIYVRASQIYSNGYKYNSSNNSQSIFISSALFQNKTDWKINLLVGQQQNQLAWLGVSDSLISIDRRTNANKNEKDRFLQALCQVQNNWQLNAVSALNSSIYYTFLNGNYDFNLNNFLELPVTYELYNFAFRSNLIGFFSNYTYSGKQFNWTSGIHGNLYDRQHTGSESSLGKLYRNTGFRNEASAFTKVTYTLNKYVFFTDIQYRYTTFDYQGSVPFKELEWQFINPKAGLSFSLNQNTTLYYSLGRAGREPTRNDLFGGNDDLPADSTGNGLLFILDPEYVLSQEVGIRKHAEKLILDLNLYYMDFKNEIVLNGKFGPNGLALTNKVEKSFRAGLEATVSYLVNDNWKFNNNSSLNYSRITEQTEIFPPILTPPLIINQEVIYSKNKFQIALTGRYQARSYIDFANSAATKGYFLLNTRIHYDLRKYQIAFFINNLTNASYFNNGYVDFDGTRKYFVQAPINFHASVYYTF